LFSFVVLNHFGPQHECLRGGNQGEIILIVAL